MVPTVLIFRSDCKVYPVLRTFTFLPAASDRQRAYHQTHCINRHHSEYTELLLCYMLKELLERRGQDLGESVDIPKNNVILEGKRVEVS